MGTYLTARILEQLIKSTEKPLFNDPGLYAGIAA